MKKYWRVDGYSWDLPLVSNHLLVPPDELHVADGARATFVILWD